MRNVCLAIGARAAPAAFVLALLAACSHSAGTTSSAPVHGPDLSPSPSVRFSVSGMAPQLSGTPTPTVTGAPTPTSTSTLRVHLGTVVLVPGYGGSTEGLSTIAAALRKVGRHVRVVALPAQASQLFEQQARTLEAVVGAEEKAGRGPVDIVAHSNGGVLARYWARHYNGAGRARVILTLGAPQHGTTLADLAFTAAPQLCTPACHEVRPSSTFLKALNKQPATAGIAWVSAYTDNDNVVTPATSAVLRGAINVRLQAVCADAVVDHSGLLGDPLALGLVVDELQAPVPHPERDGDCARLRALGS